MTNQTKINQQITRYLARREHSQAELLTKLSAKGFDMRESEQQLALFVEKNIQSNTRFCESFIRSQYNRGKGPRAIRQLLVQHEIDDAIISQMLANDELDWFELAQKVRHKKFSQAQPIDFPAKQKQMRFLQYRGFEQEHINAAFE